MRKKVDLFNPYILRPERGNKPDSWAYPTRAGGTVCIVVRDPGSGHVIACDISRARLTELADEMNRRIKKDRRRK